MLSRETCESFKNTFFKKHHRWLLLYQSNFYLPALIYSSSIFQYEEAIHEQQSHVWNSLWHLDLMMSFWFLVLYDLVEPHLQRPYYMKFVPYFFYILVILNFVLIFSVAFGLYLSCSVALLGCYRWHHHLHHLTFHYNAYSLTGH